VIVDGFVQTLLLNQYVGQDVESVMLAWENDALCQWPAEFRQYFENDGEFKVTE
jgi:hypothetical protein